MAKNLLPLVPLVVLILINLKIYFAYKKLEVICCIDTLILKEKKVELIDLTRE